MKISLNIVLKLALVGVLQACGGDAIENTDSEKTTVINTNYTDLVTIMPLDPNKFEIMKTDHKQIVENFHVYIRNMSMEKDSLQIFVNSFRNEYCKMNCNIKLYDDPSLGELMTKYPLSDKEYIKKADHLVAESIFDMKEVWMYPLQDIKYKNLGGKNWKKDPK